MFQNGFIFNMFTVRLHCEDILQRLCSKSFNVFSALICISLLCFDIFASVLIVFLYFTNKTRISIVVYQSSLKHAPYTTNKRQLRNKFPRKQGHKEICSFFQGNTDIGGELHIERLYLFSLIWSFGGLLDEPDRKKFSELLLSLTTALPDYDQEISVFDYYVDESGEWDPWQSRLVQV